jgi:flagellar motility protein MotE (MotC chaperone)
MFGEASASEEGKKEEKTAETNGKKEEEKAEVGAGHKALPEAEKKSWTADEISLFSKLEDRKRQLDSRESELNKLEEELQKQKAELEKKLAQLEDVRGKISARLDEKVKVDQQKVEALVSVYASMKPAQAAKVIEGINEDLAVEVLAKMKNKSAAEILNLMDAEKAKKISERYAGYREPASK